MLKIARRPGERVIVGDNVVVEILEVHGQTVRIGIDAPRSVPIYREEIWLAVKRENEEAAALATSAELPRVSPDPGSGGRVAGGSDPTRAAPAPPARDV